MPYTIESEIGRGGMGCVYKGRDHNGKHVAIKMMSNQLTCYPLYRTMFESEIDALRRMNHPSIVHIVGSPYSDSSGNLYLPMEYVEGDTLQNIVKTRGRLSVEKASEIMLKVLEAIQYVHDMKCIHRDIKPSNIMLRPDGRICIIDFGIAKDSKINSGHTVGKIVGSDGYMSPEQAKGLNIDHRTDIYSLGCVFYYLLTGEVAIPSGSNDYNTVNAVINMAVPRPSDKVSDIPDSLDQIVLKAADKDMTRRYQTAKSFRDALSRYSYNGDNEGAVVTIGKYPDNDIRIANEYVSRYHLIVKGTDQCEIYPGFTDYELELEDRSSNGTGINGVMLKHNTARVKCRRYADGRMTYQVISVGGKDISNSGSESSYLQIMLAGRQECMVEWNNVMYLLNQAGWPKLQISNINSDVSESTAVNNKVNINVNSNTQTIYKHNDTPGTIILILCLLFPIIGFVLWAVWKDEHPNKASKSLTFALAGFVIGALLTLILII